MKIRSKRELLVKSFVQRVSSATTFSKRYKKVCKLLDSSPDLTQEQWFYIWRGLYYSIWYTEMGKGCEPLATRIANFDDLNMILTGFKSLTNDWFGIDAIRVDKFMFLVRLMVHNCLKLQLNHFLSKPSVDQSLDSNGMQLSNDNTNESLVQSEQQLNNEEVIVEEVVDEDNDKSNGKSNGNSVSDKSKKTFKNRKNKKFNKKKESLKKVIEFPIEIRAQIIDSILTIVNSSIGLTLHIMDLFIDELVKVMNELKPKWKAEEKIDLYFNILLPFVKLLALNEDNRVRDTVKQSIFDKFKNQILVSESINTRKLVLEKFVEAMIAMGSVPQIGRKNRDSIYNIVGVFKSKLTLLSSNQNKGLKRRKIVTKSGKQKKVKYELTSGSPFVRSVVPIAVI